MCHSVRVKLSASERKQAVRLTGILLPVYASLALAILAGVYVTHSTRDGNMVAAASDVPAAAIRSAER
jgi:hypothetical protein